jgi:penicillin-binding protein 1A
MKIFNALFITIFLLGSTTLGFFFFCFTNHWIDFSPLEHSSQSKPTIVLDDEGREFVTFSKDKRESIELQKIPEHVIKAFVAAEDHAFFSHNGVSFKGIIRSALINLIHWQIIQGASTITQQLVKLLYTSSERSYIRKIKDQLLALLVERQYSKEQILQTYLNNVCFGCGIYGVQAASKRFWNKEPAQLSLEEGAALAAIVKSPTAYCPLLNPLSCEHRRNIVLNSMRVLNFISDDLYVQAIAKPLELAVPFHSTSGWHAKEAIRMFLEERFGKDMVYDTGMVVKTTFNPTMQIAAEEAFKNHITELKNWLTPHLDGGLLCMEVKSGGIKALVGGYDFNSSKFNRALQAQRQIASSFKPIIFAAALAEGKTFANTEIDEPLEIESGGDIWRPNNHTMEFVGQMTLAKALALSNNIIAIKLMLEIGIDKVIALSKKFRISAYLPPYPSLALGCVDTTLKEVAAMFNVFANDGVYVKPYFIEWVKNEVGSKIYKAEQESEQIISPRVSGQVAHVLSIGLNRARKWYKDGWPDCQAFGKTGTTNDYRSTFFVGATPEYTTSIYIGRDDNKTFGKVYGATTSFPIWKNMFAQLPAKKKFFSFDPSLKEITIDGKTGQPVADPKESGALTILV